MSAKVTGKLVVRVGDEDVIVNIGESFVTVVDLQHALKERGALFVLDRELGAAFSDVSAVVQQMIRNNSSS